MSRPEVEDALRLLAAEFGIIIHLSWSGRARRGRAHYTGWRVTLGPKCWRGTEASMVHEVAHLVAHKRFGCRRRAGWQRDHHGPHFIDALRDVAAAWYGDSQRYPWHTEYRSIRKRVVA